MPRPIKVRHVSCYPEANYFKPRGIPFVELEEIVLSTDELEAVRLADLECLYQEQAAGRMNISRQTFGNIVRSAHRKIADALVNGKALKIQGGVIAVEERRFQCQDCQHEWRLPFGTGRPMDCPQCQGANVFRALSNREPARRGKNDPNRERCRRAAG
ncbi:MAG: DUF134 domain-containing protein [Desulfobacterales bacterium]|nr:MAG: DUF134 domain-containing protein [Desulfobacterales bacterium]